MFIILYAFQNVFDATFYGLGKTNYMLFESVVTNTIYYLGLYNNEGNIAATYPLAELSGDIALLVAERERVNASAALSEEEKLARNLRLLELEVQLRYMVLINWESYGASGDKTAYACELIYYLDRLGVEYVGEGRSVQALKKEYCFDLSDYLTITYDGVAYGAASPMQIEGSAPFIDLTKLAITCSLDGVNATYRWSLYHASTCLMSTDEKLSKAYFDRTDGYFYAPVNNYGGTYRIVVEVVFTQGYIGTVSLYYNATLR